ncbi:MAG TPA: hypothetical protein VEK11_23495 [Thermoanaerobaculia bacterium]|nr:hypothetical protein [Thermoanaerobaculia bacterium]
MIAAAFLAVVAVIVFAQRKQLAKLQAGILGGSVFPGCVVAEAIVLLLIAMAMFVFRD